MSMLFDARSGNDPMRAEMPEEHGPPDNRIRLWPLGIVVLMLLGALIATLSWVRLPVPADAVQLDAVQVSLDNGPFEDATLPHLWPSIGMQGHSAATYRLMLPPIPGEGAVLLIPGARHELTIMIDGRTVPTMRSSTGMNASLGSTHALRLPLLDDEPTEIVLQLERISGYAPGYLSQLHLTSLPDFKSMQWVWRLAEQDFHLVTRVLNGAVLLCLLLLWFWRRNEPVFAWMALFAAAAFLTDQVLLFHFVMKLPLAYSAIELRGFATSSLGLISFAFALAMTGAPRPRWLKLAIVLVPIVLLVAVQMGLLPIVPAMALSALLGTIMCLAGASLLLRYAFRRTEWDRAVFATSYLTTVWFALHDFGVVVGWIDSARLLTQDMRALYMLVALILLMRWLALSLAKVDQANARLRDKLDAQRRELSQWHAKEQRRVQETALADERQRLMRDLHDGLSGHLVSIIAQSEASRCEPREIEGAARKALDDLRLVINALDLEDDDLRLALSGLRERVEQQLGRLQIGLDWSMAALPEVRGVKPGNSLAILRILQEALTNAIKHRDGGRISFEAKRFGPDRMCLSVTNRSAQAPVPGRGHGLRNMQSRAAELGGEIRFSNASGQARLQLIVPTDLHNRKPDPTPSSQLSLYPN